MNIIKGYMRGGKRTDSNSSLLHGIYYLSLSLCVCVSLSLSLSLTHVISQLQNKLVGAYNYGNCAYWTALGLKAAGIISHRSMWPVFILTLHPQHPQHPQHTHPSHTH